MSIITDAAEEAVTIAAPQLALPIRIWHWISSHALPILLAVLALWFVGHMLLSEWRAAQIAKAEATLTAQVSSATNASGADAVTTVEHNITNERNITNEVEHVQAAINAAPDAAGADAAGRAGLCGINSSFCAASGVQ